MDEMAIKGQQSVTEQQKKINEQEDRHKVSLVCANDHVPSMLFIHVGGDGKARRATTARAGTVYVHVVPRDVCTTYMYTCTCMTSDTRRISE